MGPKWEGRRKTGEAYLECSGETKTMSGLTYGGHGNVSITVETVWIAIKDARGDF